MAEATSLAANARDRAGKGAARQIRREGRIPAVIYGDKKDPVLISVDPVDLSRQLKGPGFFARVFEIDVAGDKHRVLARDLQLDPVTDRPIHVDFMRFSATTKLNVEVEMVFENEGDCPGIKKGGVLNIVRHTVEMICAADSIPESLSVDLTGMEIGDSFHAAGLTLPLGVSLAITDRDFTIATIASPTIIEDVVEEVVEGEEGEVPVDGEAPVEGEEEGEAKPEAEAETKE